MLTLSASVMLSAATPATVLVVGAVSPLDRVGV
jgi:hypothetical protein